MSISDIELQYPKLEQINDHYILMTLVACKRIISNMCSLALTIEKYCSTAITLPLTGYMDRALVECSGNLSISAGPSDKNQSHVHIISGRLGYP